MSYKNYLSNLYRPSLKKSDRSDFISLNKNEAPFSAFNSLNNLFCDEDIKSLREYPDPYKLYKKLSKFIGVDTNSLLITQGSEQAIRFIFDTFLDYGDEVIYPNPSFAMFDVFAYYNKAKVKHLNYSKNRKLSIEKILNAITSKTKLFVLANPNNPTGTVFNLSELKSIAKHTLSTNTIFLLDEAYFHFYNIDSIELIKEFKNVIITRTFSKAWGLAGIRVGYAISNFENIELLRKQKPIDEVNQLSNIICLKALKNSNLILNKNVNQVKKWKKKFKNLKIKDIEYLKSEGNFILLKSKNYKQHKEALLKNRILPKIDFNHNSLKNCIRFSISSNKIMNKIQEVLNV